MYQQRIIIVVSNKLTRYKGLYNFGHPLKPRGRSFLVVGLRFACGGQFVEEILRGEDGERRHLALHQRRLRLRDSRHRRRSSRRSVPSYLRLRRCSQKAVRETVDHDGRSEGVQAIEDDLRDGTLLRGVALCAAITQTSGKQFESRKGHDSVLVSNDWYRSFIRYARCRCVHDLRRFDKSAAGRNAGSARRSIFFVAGSICSLL
jgi:hypothetical protein